MKHILPKEIFINGRFLTQNITGVQRFGHEILWALENELTGKNVAAKVTVVVPDGTPKPGFLSEINFLPYGSRQGHIWEQVDLLMATRKGFLVNFSPSGPILKRQQLTIIHDAAIYRHPSNYSASYRLLHKSVDTALSKFSRIGTVSEFSRSELSKIFNILPANIPIISNGHEHILALKPQNTIIDRLSLRDKTFILFVGSNTPNKNLSRTIEAFSSLKLKDAKLVAVGASEKSIYNTGSEQSSENIIRPGRLSDEEIAALYQHATTLIFPSLYEGFGIPPIEAMALGCPVIASHIPPVIEACGDVALYFDPLNTNDISLKIKNILESEVLRNDLRQKGLLRVRQFSWSKSAKKLLEIIDQVRS